MNPNYFKDIHGEKDLPNNYINYLSAQVILLQQLFCLKMAKIKLTLGDTNKTITRKAQENLLGERIL